MDTKPMRLPGVITLYQDSQTGKAGVLDGQHRIGALKILAQDEAVWPRQQPVLVEVVTVNDGTETKAPEPAPVSTPFISTCPVTQVVSMVQELFTEINKAEPLKLVDMPDATTMYHRTMLQSVASQLAKEYKPMFKATSRCRAPHTNVDNLRDELFQAEVFVFGLVCCGFCQH